MKKQIGNISIDYTKNNDKIIINKIKNSKKSLFDNSVIEFFENERGDTIMKKFNMVEIIADNGESEILSSQDFNKKNMTKKEFEKAIYDKYGKSGICEIIFS